MRKANFAGAAVTASLLFAGASPAFAVPTVTSFTCAADTAIVNVGGAAGLTLDPLRANPDPNAVCKNDGSTIPSLNATNPLSPGIPVPVTLSSGTAFAQTALADGGAPTFMQSVAAQSGGENLNVNLNNGSLVIGAKAVFSAVGGSCVNGVPTFPVQSRVVGLTINGTEITADTQVLEPLTAQLAGTPLAGLVKVTLNATTTTGAGTNDVQVVREAARIEILSAAGSPVATVVLGRASADSHGPVCVPPPGKPGTTNTVTNTVTTPGANTNNGANANANGTGTGTGPPKLNGTNASRCAHLKMFFVRKRKPVFAARVGFATSGPTSIRSRFGQRQVTRGRIVNCKGKAIVRAKIDVIHIIRGNRHLIKTGLRSRAAGRLTLILPLNISTRDIRYEYRPFTNRKTVATRRTLHVTVRNRRGKIIR